MIIMMMKIYASYIEYITNWLSNKQNILAAKSQSSSLSFFLHHFNLGEIFSHFKIVTNYAESEENIYFRLGICETVLERFLSTSFRRSLKFRV